jgi:hypothetical protein
MINLFHCAIETMSTNRKQVKTVFCPEVGLPDDFKSHSRKRGRSSFHASNKKQTQDKSFEHLLSSVKDFSSVSLTGQSRKKFEDDKLTKLGALPVKQQKMPFQMRIGLIAGKKKRDARKNIELKESGQVVAKSQQQKSKSKPREKKDRGLDVNTRGGVFHLKKSNIPSKHRR